MGLKGNPVLYTKIPFIRSHSLQFRLYFLYKRLFLPHYLLIFTNILAGPYQPQYVIHNNGRLVIGPGHLHHGFDYVINTSTGCYTDFIQYGNGVGVRLAVIAISQLLKKSQAKGNPMPYIS